MTQYSKKILSMLLWVWGGTIYFILEVIWKVFTTPERISWTMLVIAIILSIPLERCGAELPWEMPLALQSLICTCVVTVTELAAGIVLNILLKLDIWDYSALWGNFMGQICPLYTVIWYVLCFAFIPIFDLIRWSIEGGEKPTYKLF